MRLVEDQSPVEPRDFEFPVELEQLFADPAGQPEPPGTPRTSGTPGTSGTPAAPGPHEELEAAQADDAPWHVEAHPDGGWAVLRRGESLAGGSQPMAVLLQRRTAELTAAILSVDPAHVRYRLVHEPEEQGYPILDSDGTVIGHLAKPDERLLRALNLVDALVSSPRGLLLLSAAAGGRTLDQAGRMALARALAGRLPERTP